MPVYYYSLPFHYYNTWMLGDFIIDDFGNSVETNGSYGIDYCYYADE